MEKLQEHNKNGLTTDVLASVFVGSIAGLIVKNSMYFYESIIQPPLAPPSFLFPVVWTVLYALMGLSAYLILKSGSPDTKSAMIIFIIQLVLNVTWPIIFFRFQLFLLAFFWIIFMWVAILLMIRAFSGINKVAAYLQIPYLIWVSFAGYLTLAIYILNR